MTPPWHTTHTTPPTAPRTHPSTILVPLASDLVSQPSSASVFDPIERKIGSRDGVHDGDSGSSGGSGGAGGTVPSLMSSSASGTPIAMTSPFAFSMSTDDEKDAAKALSKKITSLSWWTPGSS